MTKSYTANTTQLHEGDDRFITSEQLWGAPFEFVGRLIDEHMELKQTNDLDDLGHHCHGLPLVAVRHHIPEHEGSGYHEIFKPSSHLMISISDAHYRRRTWVSVEGKCFFKLRILLSGQLSDRHGKTLLTAPQAHLQLSSGRSCDGYTMHPGAPLRMIILHCPPEFLTEYLALDFRSLPKPLSLLFKDHAGETAVLRIELTTTLFNAANRIFESGHLMPSKLRGAFLESLGTEIMCEVIAGISKSAALSKLELGTTARDLNRVYKVRDYIGQNYASALRVQNLARMVGVNQTKLRATFKSVLNTTICDYVKHVRMEKAQELLLSNELNISEVSYLVGYEYPSNFTSAFKKYFGLLPRSLKGRSGSRQQV